ncbi:MAG TPA: TolC family protein [Flavisolibacter sp.]|nr:TolC family protein [Flavisolibacter sp.]
MKLKNIVFVSSCLIGLISKAQRPLTVEEAIATSLANNYDIRLSRNDSSLAALDNAFANYAFYPRLNASAGINYNNNNQKQVLADGTKRESNGIKSNASNASLNLNWTLFDGLKMFITRRRLGQLVELGELQIKNQVITTVSNVMRIYYDISRQQHQLKATEEQMQLSSERFKLAQYKFDVGTGTKSDVLQAQIDYNAQRSQQLTQQTAIIKLKEQLNNLLAAPITAEFTVLDTIPLNTGLTLEFIQNEINTTNPQLLLAQKQIDIANLVLKERRAERFPIVSFNSAYNFNRTDNKSVINPFQPLFNQNHGLNYGFTATIPIFNGYITRRNIRSAELDIEYQQLLYQKSATDINTSVITAYRDYGLYRETLSLEEENIKLVRENLYIARERYRLGVTTFLEMRTAEQSLADATNRLIQARYNTKVAEIELLRLRGNLVR